MLKRLFVLCISLLPAFLLVSCGDGGSESGSEQSSTSGNQMSRYSDGDENQPEDSERLHGIVDQSRSAATSWPCIFSYDKGRRIYSSKIHHKSIARGNGGAWRVWARSTAGQAKIDAVKICNKYFKPCSTYDINGDVCGTTTFSISVPSGGERWKSGKKYTIKWSKGKAGATVKIQLLKSGKHYKWVAKKTKNDGKHVWKIPTKIATGSAYKIKITSTKNKKMTVKSSKNFAIHKSSTADKYSYLNKHNAYALGGYTIRWKSKTIQVSGAKGAWKNAVKRWPTVRFRFVGSSPSRGKGIEILGYVNSGWTGNTCGYASWSFWGDGRLATCKIKMNPSASCKSRPLEQNIMTHEIGHCIGIFKHTTDHGVMDAIVGNSTFTSPVRRMITLLYSLPPGTNINSKLSRSAATKQRSDSDKYDPTGVKLYSGSSYFMKNGEVKIVPNW